MESVYCLLKYSRAAAAFVVAAALATGAIAALMPWSVALRVALEAFVAAYAAHALGRLGAVRAVYVHLDGHVRIEWSNGGTGEGSLAAGGFVAPWLVCVRWRPHAAWFDRTVLVLPDMLSGDAFRRLRVVLRSA